MSSQQDGMLRTASSLMALQLVSRLFTSALNQALIRLASPAALGAAAIQFELLLGTILFLSREGVRHALLRTPKSSAIVDDATKTETSATTSTNIASSNLALVPLLLGLPLTVVAAVGYAVYAPGEVQLQPGFRATVAVYALAALLELACEPMHNHSVIEMKTAVRVRAEGLGVGAKSLMTFLILFYDSRLSTQPPGSFALFAFAGGQMAYSIVLFVTYVYNYRDTLSSFRLAKLRNVPVPAEQVARRGPAEAYFDLDLLKLSMTLNAQFVLKHILTEGDKVVLSWYSPLAEQGGYAVAANYGSLIARLVFQPIEETSRVFFAKSTSAFSSKSESKVMADDPSLLENNAIRMSALRRPSAFLSSILQTQLSLAVPIIVFGHAYLPIILPFLLPARFLATSAPQLLRAWVYYLPVLAVNGVLEAFVAGTATTKDVVRQSRWMTLFSAIYISTAIALYQLGYGDVSLVYANIVGLSVRIIYAALFVTNYFHRHAKSLVSTDETPPRLLHRHNTLPDPRLLLVCATAQGIVTYSARRRRIAQRVAAVMIGQRDKLTLLSKPVIVHVGLGGVLGLACLMTWWACSGRHMEILQMTKEERKTKVE
ncbi:hypothetical protein HGRIS_006638 [Hohenbuehelia grisea]|uniref:Man(5)GlcNAc(2)-PP-dolichol translocation protein RFT1 n=1 Tax=Hohenbuehelia grisea TaxID=104357 RepID=A0ABR3J9M7_9AGAR